MAACNESKRSASFFISFAQGERVAELILRHARASECQDVPQFKKEMAQLVDHALSNTLSLGKVLNQICTFLSVLFFSCRAA